MLVCNKCFLENCKCENKTMVEIDDNILEIIRILNNKGYKTRYCCEGHNEFNFLYIYVYFIKDYNFKKIPNNFKLKRNNEILYYSLGERYSLKKRIKEKEIALKELYKWCKKLKKIS